MHAVSLAPVAWRGFGLVYLGFASPLGAMFIYLAAQLLAEPTRLWAARLFHYSLLYLALLFTAIAVDAVV